MSHRRVHAKRSGSGRCLSRRSGPRRRRNRGISWWRSDSRESRSFDVRRSWTLYSARNRFVGRFNFFADQNMVLIAFFRWSRRTDVHSTMRWLQVLSFEKDKFVRTNQVIIIIVFTDWILSFINLWYIKWRYCRLTQGKGVMPDGTSRFSCKGQSLLHFMGCSTFSEYTVGCRYICR